MPHSLSSAVASRTKPFSAEESRFAAAVFNVSSRQGIAWKAEGPVDLIDKQTFEE